jgi:hypothetical protein
MTSVDLLDVAAIARARRGLRGALLSCPPVSERSSRLARQRQGTYTPRALQTDSCWASDDPNPNATAARWIPRRITSLFEQPHIRMTPDFISIALPYNAGVEYVRYIVPHLLRD